MMQLSVILDALEAIAPTSQAESWDNVGLIVGDPASSVSRAMLCIDYTHAVRDEAKQAGCDLIVAYHPPIFESIKRVTADGSSDLIHDAIRRGVAIYSPHTALDVAPGGTNDVLADVISLQDRRPLKLRESRTNNLKLVTFVPTDALDRVADAIFSAGGGCIGRYSHCSFRSAGTGTFKGGEGTNPAIGSPGVLERVDEMRLEVALPTHRASDVISALKRAHPYEEVAFDLFTMQPDPTTTPVGLGRVGRLPSDISAEMLINLLKRSLGLNRLMFVGDPQRLVRNVAVCAGACGGDLLSAVIALKVDCYISGEMRHHDALRAERAGLSVVCTLHSHSERIALARLAQMMRDRLPTLDLRLSSADRDPFAIL
jgi:dinuclear metal center YbgI/SA1388 family protein